VNQSYARLHEAFILPGLAWLLNHNPRRL
jgi:hypothetical protein